MVLFYVYPKNPRKDHWFSLLVLLILCFVVAGAGGMAATPNIPWYAGLVKPSWTPPSWVFGPVWSALYLCMAVAAWLVWRQGNVAVSMMLFGVQLAFNAAWSWLFFGLHSPRAAFVDIILLLAAIIATAVSFWRCSTVAGILFVPYLIWVSFVAVLNYAVWRLNS